MNDNRYAEELLRRTLREEADEVYGGLTVDVIRRDALAQRRRSLWRTALIVAAAAAVLAGVPTAVVLGSGDDRHERPSALTSPTPVPSSAAPSPRVEATPTPDNSELAKVPRGPDITIPWMSDGVIHVPNGQDVTLQMPFAGPWHAFTPYHGGWLLAGDAGVVQVDADGGTEPVARSGTGIAVSRDGTQTAFFADGPLRVGSTIAGGDRGDAVPVIPMPGPVESGPVGFLSSGAVVYNGEDGQVRVAEPSGTTRSARGILRASATAKGDLLAGRTPDNDGVVVALMSSGTNLWTKSGWIPAQFSPDGRYLAAYQTATGGEFETIGFLDARAGTVVATNKTERIPALPATPTAWEDDRHLLIPYRGGDSWTVLRLGADGTMNRATDVFPGDPVTASLVFSARP